MIHYLKFVEFYASQNCNSVYVHNVIYLNVNLLRGSYSLGRTLAASHIRSLLNCSDIYETPWTNDKSLARPLPAQESTTQKGEDKHTCLERNLNRRPQRRSDQALHLSQRGNFYPHFNVTTWVKLCIKLSRRRLKMVCNFVVSEINLSVITFKFVISSSYNVRFVTTVRSIIIL
jgi:hypothetical protein